MIARFAILCVLAACAGNPYRRSAGEWAHARQTAERYLRDKYGTAWRIEEERHGLPFMFAIRVDDAWAVLVHEDAIFTQRGLAGLDRYLRQSRCVEQRLASSDDVVRLLRFLEAMPPETDPHVGNNPIGRRDKLRDLRPHLEYLDDGRARLSLHYHVEIEQDPNVDYGGGDGDDAPDPDHLIKTWTLDMAPGQMPVWTSQMRIFNEKTHRFRPVEAPL